MLLLTKFLRTVQARMHAQNNVGDATPSVRKNVSDVVGILRNYVDLKMYYFVITCKNSKTELFDGRIAKDKR